MKKFKNVNNPIITCIGAILFSVFIDLIIWFVCANVVVVAYFVWAVIKAVWGI